jgi:hypothetical protein
MLDARNSKPLQKIMTKGRAKNISAVIINQNYKGSEPIIRTNSTHCIFFNNNDGEIHKIYEEHGGNLPEDVFKTTFKLGTMPYRDMLKPFLLIDYKTDQKSHKYRRGFDLPLG